MKKRFSIIISPAKKMLADIDTLEHSSLPAFLDEADTIANVLRSMSYEELRGLWQCNDSIATLNHRRLSRMDLRQNLTPALIAYDGIQYSYMGASVFEDRHFDYVNERLRILSGFYGILRPFDGVVPYRLEMQAKLSVNGSKNLYDFWGDKLATSLMSESDTIINLASKEYSGAVSAHLPKQFPFITCVFGELKGGKVTEKGTLCKMARGRMVRWLADNNISDVSDIKRFSELDFHFADDLSTDNKYVFLKESDKSKQSAMF